ncbi:VOC family protein [Gaiella sp.]|uniref:VOC family protein n=1 Tax=Gaiella sp. TaxID=2663207 RepID=UPI003264EBD1
MFDHVTIRVSDRLTSEAAYAAVLGELGVESTYADDWFVEWEEFSLLEASNGRRATSGLHIGFVAPSRAHVDAFWHAGRANGLGDAGAPGERPDYKADYYGAFLLDPDR